MLITEHPVYEPARPFYRSDASTQRLGAVSGLLYRLLGVGASNRNLAEIRAAAPPGDYP